MVKQAVFIYTESLSADLCEQRIVKTVLERNQHSSTKPACICTFLPLHSQLLSVNAAFKSSVYKSYTMSNST